MFLMQRVYIRQSAGFSLRKISGDLEMALVGLIVREQLGVLINPMSATGRR